MTANNDRPARPPADAGDEPSHSIGADQLAHVHAMQFLRLIVSAIIEGLVTDLERVVVVMADGETRDLPCNAVEILRFLYTGGFVPIRSVSVQEPGTRRIYRDGDDFLESRVRQAIRAELGAQFSEAHWSALREEMADSALNEARSLGSRPGSMRRCAS